MYLTPRQKRKNLITILILALGVPLSVFAAWQVVQIISNASGDPTPIDIVISNVSTSSATIGWVTESSVNGAVVLVENGDDTVQEIDKRGNGKRKTHYVEMTDLEPNSQYTFEIVSGEERFTKDENGNSFKFVTAPVSSSVTTPNTVYGSGGNFSGDDFIVYIINKSQSSYPVSVVPNTSGGWAADLSGFRSTDGMSIITMNDSDNLEIIAVSGVDMGDMVEGSYSDLFDSSGELRELYSLSPEENTNLMASFADYSFEVIEEEEEDDDNDDNGDSGNETPVVPDTDDEEEFNRVFRIVYDLNWIDMVKAGENLNIVTGEDSVIVSNLRDTGFDVVWVSDDEEEGYILYGTSEEDISIEARDSRDSLTNKDEYRIHYVEVDDLDPETKYYFNIHSGNETYDSLTVTTFSTLSSAPSIASISGDVEEVPSEDSVVIVGKIYDGDDEGTSGNSVYISVMADSSGGWILPIADARSEDGSSYFSYTDGDIIKLFAVCLGESEILEKSMENVVEEDLVITVSGDANTVTYTRIPLLSDYGIN